MHFYLFGVILQTIILIFYLTADSKLFHQFCNLNRLIFSNGSIEFLASISDKQIYLAYIFLNFQLLRRFYENTCVSIVSNSNIHYAHYLLGYLFYFSINLLQFNLLFRRSVKRRAGINQLLFLLNFRQSSLFSWLYNSTHYAKTICIITL